MNEAAEKPIEQMSASELCDTLNASGNAKVRRLGRGRGVVVSAAGHRIQATSTGFKPLDKTRERARRARRRSHVSK
jgi:hypothetical protein